jgi:hypothetical protein
VREKAFVLAITRGRDRVADPAFYRVVDLAAKENRRRSEFRIGQALISGMELSCRTSLLPHSAKPAARRCGFVILYPQLWDLKCGLGNRIEIRRERGIAEAQVLEARQRENAQCRMNLPAALLVARILA